MPPLANTSTVPVSAGTVEFAESFAWDFPIEVDAVQSLKDWCDTPMTALDNAIVDATTARGQVEHQRARLVETVVEHLTNMISASEHAVSCFRALHSALEDYAGAMQPNRTEFQAIITDATAAGLTVSQAGTQVTISHPADVPGGVGVIFASLRERCSINQKKFAYAPLPTGPVGRRSAMNGLHDVVWSGTKHPEEAFQWIAYMASEQCQMKVGESGVIFPAVTKATEASLKAREAQGQDNSAFTTVVDNKETFPVPVFAHGDEVNALIQDAIQAIATGADPASTLQEANDKANALLK